MSGAEVDLGGCDGCGLGCALTCASQSAGRVRRARGTLTATGLALLLLGSVPGVVVGSWARVPAAVAALLGVAVALLGAGSRRAHGARGDLAARWAYRLVPAGTAALLVTWLAAVAIALVG